jgi:hypothetical protein
MAAARGFAAFKQRPFVHLASFGALHVGLAWALIPPIYLFLNNTNTATSLLAGPQAAYILSRKVPAWVPSPEGRLAVSEKGEVSGKTHAAATDGERTVEDYIEAVLKSSVATGWKGGKAVLGGAKSLTAQLASLGGDHKPEEASEMVGDALKDVTGGHGSTSAKLKSMAGNAWDSTIGKRARERADDLKYGQIRDAVAAWVLVKVSGMFFG